MPPQTRALFPSERACATLVYVRLGCPIVVSVNVCRPPKWLRRTVAAAPFWLGCPAGYSGCDGVLMSGSHSGSAAVSGLPSESANGIEVTGRQVTSVGTEPYNRLLLQMLIAVSAIARFTAARSRLLWERHRLLARAIWFA